jgi:NADP-dependent 3-hydroxy acid dehydrogenase YdfG
LGTGLEIFSKSSNVVEVGCDPNIHYFMNSTDNSTPGSSSAQDFQAPNFFKFQGKRFVVTGGSKGIGQSVAEMLLQSGAEVWIVSRDAALQKERLEEWKENGWNAHGVVCDLMDAGSRREALDHLKSQISSLKGLILNAGVNIRKKTSDYTSEDLRSVWSVNYESVFEFCQGLYPALKKSKKGSVTFVSSVAGMRFVPSGAPYATSKAAVDHSNPSGRAGAEGYGPFEKHIVGHPYESNRGTGRSGESGVISQFRCCLIYHWTGYCCGWRISGAGNQRRSDCELVG